MTLLVLASLAVVAVLVLRLRFIGPRLISRVRSVRNERL